jgi:hypothetical protein
MKGAKIREFSVKGCCLLLLWSAFALKINAQEIKSVRLLEFKYGVHFPAADLADRFGTNNDFGISIQSVGLNKRTFFGLEGYYIFGNAVNEDVIASLRTFDGSIIGIDGGPADVNVKERGYYIGINAGKIFPTTEHKNKLTGIRAQIGAGMLQHKIRVQDNSRTVVALEKQYLPGYDRLTNGPAIHLGLGYQYQSPKNNFHFHIMADLYGARTQSRRDFDFPTGEYLDQKRTDILGGISLAYIVLISRPVSSEHIYY